MDWASDEALLTLRRELTQESARLKIIMDCGKLADETTGLLAVERELKLRGL